MRWCCGVVCGFLLALAIGIAIFYFCYLKENPDVAAEGMGKVEEQWQKTKDGGDKVIETIKPLLPESNNNQNGEKPVQGAAAVTDD